MDDAELVAGFWDALYRRDWDAVGGFFADDAHYEDVPAPDLGAVGPAAIVRRLRIGLEPIERYEHHLVRMLAGDGCVMTEHREDWHWHTGESVSLPFVSVMEVGGARIRRWSDYWDYQTLLGQAPQWWVDHIMAEYAREPFAGPTA